MISKHAIKNYLNRELMSFSWMKKLPKDEIDEAIADLFPRPRLRFQRPWLHQKVCFLLGITFQRFMFFKDMGLGKTLTVLWMISYRKQRGERPRVLVLVPYITALSTWEDEVAERTPHLTCVVLDKGSEQNRELLNSDADLFVGCYQTAVAMCSRKILDTKKKKNKWHFEAKDVRKLFGNFDTLVIDEAHKVKNPNSLTYRMCRAISKNADWCFGLTGTPFGRDLQDLWAEFFIVDLGETLGPTLGLYREVFFDKKDKYWGGFEWKFKKRLMPNLKRMIKNRSIRYKVSECVDMPKRVRIKKQLRPTEGIAGYYNNAVDKIDQMRKGGKKNYHEMESEWHKLRQLSSGFMTLKGEDTNKVQVKFDENPKLEALLNLIESMPDGRKMVVFHDYVYTNKLISDELTKHKIGHARVWGKSKNSRAEIRRFRTDPDCRILVINSRSGSSSLNLQLANYLVYFEQPASSIDREQSEARLWRSGQKRRVFIYDLIMVGTEDARMYRSNREGHNLLKAVLDGTKKLRKLKGANSNERIRTRTRVA